MLRSIKDLRGYRLIGTDGEVGHLEDVYFDDAKWTVRYLVARTGMLFSGRRHVLISPLAIQRADWDDRAIHLTLTDRQVRESPDIDLDRPLSREQELEYNRFFGWPYWGLTGMGMGGPLPMAGAVTLLARPAVRPGGVEAEEEHRDPHLRSAAAVIGHHLQALDDELGHLDDFLADSETWALRYLVVDTRNWWFGRKVLLSPEWVDEVSWPEGRIYAGLTREEIERSHEWDPAQPPAPGSEHLPHARGEHPAMAREEPEERGQAARYPELADHSGDARH